MKEEFITLKFSVDEPVYFKLGDYVDDSFGLFELCDLYKPTYNQNTGGYDYELRLDAHYWKWKNKIFKYTPEVGGKEASWNLTANLKTHLDVLLRNLKALGYKYKETDFTYDIDKVVETSAKLLSYDNTNLLDALTMLAEAWECEWWITNSVIHFGRCEFSDPVNFELGKNVESMTQSDSQSNYATRIYAFGSERNIHPTYRRKLIFNVTNVTGRNISDSSRPLEYGYFPSRDHIPVPGVDFSFSKEESKRYTSLPLEYSIAFKLFDSLKAGKYNIHPKDMHISASTMGIQGITASLMLLYSVDGEEKSIVLQKTSGDGMFVSTAVFGDSKFDLYKDASNLRLRVDAVVGFIGIDIDVTVSFITNFSGTLQNKAVSSAASVTFTSGTNAGKTFNSIFNPNFSKGSLANIIQLPEGATASTGDTYVIDNIIKGKVPISYFSNDLEDVVVSGIVQKRLMLPVDTPYIDAYLDMTTEEAVEAVVVFDDVYPHRVGTMSGVVKHPVKIEDEEVDLYRFKDSEIEFSKDYIIPGNELQITFESGLLNGMIFGAKFNPDGKNPEEQLWQIVRNDDYGRMLPDENLFPKDGDKYMLSGFDTAFVSETMVPDAEKELKKKAEEYIKKTQIDPSTYDCTMMSGDMVDKNGKPTLFEAGDRVNLINAAFFDSGKRESRVIGFEYNLDFLYDSPIYTVGETAPYSRIGEIEDKIDSLTYKGKAYSNQSGIGSGGSSVYLIRTNDSTPATDSNAFSAKRALSEFVNKKVDDTVEGNITFKKEIEVEQLATIARCVVDMISSPTFVDGFTGEGFQIWKSIATGEWNMTIDNLTIRKMFTVFELLVQKIRSVGGMIVVSATDGKIETVEQVGENYEITFASANGFLPNDLIRHQVFTGEKVDYYWTEVKSVDGNKVIIPVSEFEGIVPQVGDECVLMGNTKNKLRQGLITIAATEDGQPRIDVLTGVNKKSFEGNLAVRMGNLDGIKDTYFPADNQPHGDGLYGVNCYLRGTFLLTTGEDVLTKFAVMENLFRSEMESLRNEIQEKDNYLSNSAFASSTDKWGTTNDVRFFTVNNKLLYFNRNFYSEKKQVADIIDTGARKVLRIKASGIKQINTDLSDKPDKDSSFFVSFRIRVLGKGTLTVGFPGQGLYHTEMLEPTDEFTQKEYSGTWNGAGYFELKFTGDAYIHSLAVTDNAIADLYTHFNSKFEQTNKKIEAVVTSVNNLEKKSSGWLTEADGTKIWACCQFQDGTKALSLFDITPEGIFLSGSHINLKGKVTFESFSPDFQAAYNQAFSNASMTAKDDVARQLGFTNYNQLVANAANGKSILIGGYLNTQLIDVDTLLANKIITNKVVTSLSGKRIEIDPATNSIKLYSPENRELASFHFQDDREYAMVSFSNYDSSGKEISSGFMGANLIQLSDTDIYGKSKMVMISSDGIKFYHEGEGFTKEYPSR